jgi:hypothetical protein
MRRTTALSLISLIPAVAAAMNMQDGLWEITVRMEMPGMPALPPQVMQQCITPQDTQDPRRTVPADKNCEVRNVKQEGNSLSWDMQCRGDTPMTGQGRMTAAGASYSGEMNMRITEGGQAMNVRQVMAGKRLGPCK